MSSDNCPRCEGFGAVMPGGGGIDPRDVDAVPCEACDGSGAGVDVQEKAKRLHLTLTLDTTQAVALLERCAKAEAKLAATQQELEIVKDMLTKSFAMAFAMGAPPHCTLEEAMVHVVAAPRKICDWLLNAGNRLVDAMEMQEKREAGHFHIKAETAHAIWEDAKDGWQRAKDGAK